MPMMTYVKKFSKYFILSLLCASVPQVSADESILRECFSHLHRAVETGMYPNGSKKFDRCVLDSHPDGPFLIWNEKGQMIKSGTCRNGFIQNPKDLKDSSEPLCQIIEMHVSIYPSYPPGPM